MKTNDSLNSHYRTERIVKILSLISISGFAVGIIFLILAVIFNLPLDGTIYDKIAIIGIGIIFVFPFMLMQFFMSAGLYQRGLGRVWYLVFYLMLFPFIDVWFFTAISTLFDILPTPRRVDLTLANMTLEEYRQIAGGYILGIYILLNGAGLLWRIEKNVTRKSQLVLLSL